MPGSLTTPGPAGARNDAPASFAFRGVNNVGPRVSNAFAAHWLAYTLPYRRFADVLADACARIRGDVDRYSFIAVDFHHILLAGFSRRTHSRYRPLDCSVAQGDLCHEAPILPVTRPSRSSATRSIDNSLGGFLLHW